jgi:hypothetical protein
MGFGAPVVRQTPMVGYRQYSHRAFCYFVNDRVREPMPFNGIEHLGAKSIGDELATISVPKKCFSNIVLSSRRNFYVVRTHRAMSRARACAQGAALATPERKSALRRAISLAHASDTADSSSPSRLSSNAISTADRSCGINASASSMTWSKCAFMLEILAVKGQRRLMRAWSLFLVEALRSE